MQTERRLRLAQVGDSPVIEFAVSELAGYLKRMDAGLAVDVLCLEDPAADCGKAIRIGCGLAGNPPLPDVADPEKDDAILISVSENEGIVTGTNPRSVLIAVYRLLKELGCAWVRPGKGGERIPCRKVEDISVSVREKAARRHRGVCIEGAVSYDHVRNMIDFLPKVGMNEYFVQFLTPYIFFDRWYSHPGTSQEAGPYPSKEQISRKTVDAMTVSLEKEIARRGLCYHKVGHGWTCEPFGIEGLGWYPNRKYNVPEETKPLLAMLDGKRELFHNTPLNTNLCYSNPLVREKITQAICDYCREHPQVDVVHFWLADSHNNQCECEACRKKRPADWYVDLLNALDEKMTQAGVPTRVVFLVYVDLLWAPETEKLRHPDRFILMFAPITRSYGQCYGQCLDHPAALPPYTRNQLTMPASLAENLAHLRAWQKHFSGDSFSFDYHLMWAHVMDPAYEKCARNLFQDMKDLPRIGLNGMVSCQTQRCFFPTAMPFGMMAAALWDDTADYEEKAKEYYRAAYGPDGEKVHACLGRISDLLSLYDSPARLLYEGKGTSCCADKDELTRCVDDLEALLHHHQEDARTGEEWELLSYYHAYLTRYLEVISRVDAQDPAGARKALDRLVGFMRENENVLQDCLDVPNTENSLRRKFGFVNQ